MPRQGTANTRDCLDHVVMFGEADFRRVLKAYALYYSEVPTHLALDGRARVQAAQPLGDILPLPLLGE